jgi:hypothetical protein
MRQRKIEPHKKNPAALMRSPGRISGPAAMPGARYWQTY